MSATSSVADQDSSGSSALRPVVSGERSRHERAQGLVDVPAWFARVVRRVVVECIPSLRIESKCGRVAVTALVTRDRSGGREVSRALSIPPRRLSREARRPVALPAHAQDASRQPGDHRPVRVLATH